MFNSTHTLAGIALSRTGLDRWAPFATWTAVIASNLPDIDILTGFISTASYLDHHRGVTHSLIGVPVLSLMIALVMAWISRKAGKPPVPFCRHFGIAFIVMATHPLLDWMNSYGWRPFIPFDGTWYRGDVLFVIDLYLDLILLVAILMRRRSLVFMAVLYIGAMVGLRSAAEHQLGQFMSNIPAITRSAVSPVALNPFRWTGFLETEDAISRVSIDIVGGKVERLDQFPEGKSSPVIVAAESTYTGKVFSGFARFPISRVDPTPSGYRVLLFDYQFFRAGSITALAAEILIRRDLTVESESLSFTRRVE
jgi:inner membrane protein